MSQPYLAHFALKEPPFSKEIPDAELWLPESKQAVVDGLLSTGDAATAAQTIRNSAFPEHKAFAFDATDGSSN